MDDKDLCEMCGHQFHGLTCIHVVETYLDKDYKIKKVEKCKCPGPWAVEKEE